MKKALFLPLLVCLLAGCGSVPELGIDAAARIDLEAADGAVISITDEEAARHIVENLASLKLEKQETNDPAEQAYTLRCYDAGGTTLNTFTVPSGSDPWLGFDGYPHTVAEGALDTAFWDEQLASVRSVVVRAWEGPTTTAEYAYQYANMKLDLPSGWEYAIHGGSAEGGDIHAMPAEIFGIQFWPEEYPDGKIGVYYFSNGFGVCGTGLETEEYVFGNGLVGSMGTYDNHAVWDYIFFDGLPGDYAVMNEGAVGWWPEHGNTAMEILNTARLGSGVIHEGEAISIVEGECKVNYDHTRTRFDFMEGRWEIGFYEDGASVAAQTIGVSANGAVLATAYGE